MPAKLCYTSYKSHSVYSSPLLETNSSIIYNPGWLIKQQCENHANDAIRCNIISIIISLSHGLINFQYYIYIKNISVGKKYPKRVLISLLIIVQEGPRLGAEERGPQCVCVYMGLGGGEYQIVCVLHMHSTFILIHL